MGYEMDSTQMRNPLENQQLTSTQRDTLVDHYLPMYTMFTLFFKIWYQIWYQIKTPTSTTDAVRFPCSEELAGSLQPKP